MKDDLVKRVKLPSFDRLHKLLRYDRNDGILYWRERCSGDFHADYHAPETACKTWNSRFAGKPALNTKRNNSYRSGMIDYQSYYAHRVVWKMLYNEEPKHIDHINGDKYDNRAANLRAVTHRQNMRNVPSPRKTSAPFRGIWERGGSYSARIKTDDGQKHIGTFRTLEDAIQARLKAERENGYHENHGRPY